MIKEAKPEQESELSACVRRVMRQYFHDLEGEKPGPVYDMVIASVEKPLIEVVLQVAAGNQTRAAEILAINRNTLRKKMTTYRIE